jgi:hypothetical protein
MAHSENPDGEEGSGERSNETSSNSMNDWRCASRVARWRASVARILSEVSSALRIWDLGASLQARCVGGSLLYSRGGLKKGMGMPELWSEELWEVNRGVAAGVGCPHEGGS